MSAFDMPTKTIRFDDPDDPENSWDEGEEVVIRELSYGESTKMAKACTGKDGELDGQKYADMLLPVAIASWTFKQNGEDVSVNLETIRGLPQSYVLFIAEKIGEFIVDTDEDFPSEA